MGGLQGTALRFLSCMRGSSTVLVGNRDTAIVVALTLALAPAEFVVLFLVFAQSLSFSLSHAG